MKGNVLANKEKEGKFFRFGLRTLVVLSCCGYIDGKCARTAAIYELFERACKR